MYEREMRNENSICLSKAGKNVRTGNAERKQHLPEQSRKEVRTRTRSEILPEESAERAGNAEL